MKNDRIGIFIKKIREEKGWSQEVLADKIYCSRTKINKIENNNQYLNIDDLIALSEVLEVSIEEIVSGEKITEKNKNKFNKNMINFLSLNNSKFKRAKIFSIFLVVIIITLFLLMTVLYFFQNYGSIRIYKMYGESEKYQIVNGLLILSKERIYFDLREIVPNIDEVEIFCEEDNNKHLVYKGSPNNILNDLYGYNSIISYKKFIEGKQSFYVKIADDEIKLNFIEDFKNDNFWNKEVDEIGINNNSEYEFSIPKKIKEKFDCFENYCILNTKNEAVTYNDNILIVTNEDINIIYDISGNVFSYEENVGKKNEVKFTLKNDELLCLKGKCDNANKIFSDFTINYINKYLD